MPPVTMEREEVICYKSQIPEVVQLIEDEFAGISEVQEVAVNVRVRNRLVVYIYIDREAAKNCGSDLAFPEEMGLVYDDTAESKEKLPRLLLTQRAAELECEKRVSELYPNLKIEWVPLLRTAGSNSVTSAW